MMQHDSRTQAALDKLMQENGFTGESRFHRDTLPDFLSPTDDPAIAQLSANTDPSEAVQNVYEQGHLIVAQQLGQGLSFAESADNQWRDERRVSVEVRLQDVLDQGGLIYPVETVITERVWYFTLPAGNIRVRRTT